MTVAVEFDEAKRQANLVKHRIDFRDAAEVLNGITHDIADTRQDYGEPRTNSVGRLRGRMVIVCWTPRGARRRVISMRKCNAREQALFRSYV